MYKEYPVLGGDYFVYDLFTKFHHIIVTTFKKKSVIGPIKAIRINC